MIPNILCILAFLGAFDRSSADRLFGEESWTAARAGYEEILDRAEKGTERADLLERIGRTWLMDGSFWEAEGFFARSIQEHETALARLHRGQAFFYVGRRASAERGAMGAEVRALMNDAGREFERCLELDPSSGDAHYFLGLCAAYRVEPEKEEAAYRKALEVVPGHPSASLDLANLLARKGSAEEARKVLEAVPNQARTSWHWILIGDHAGAAGDRDTMIAAYRGALRLDLADPVPYDRLWQVTGFRRHFAAFRKIMEDVIAENPEAWLAHYFLGFCHRHAKNPEAAIREFERTLEMRPEETGALRQIAEIRYRDMRDEDGAIVLYLAVLRGKPDDTTARRVLSGIGLQRAAAGDLELAGRIFRALRVADPAEFSHTANLALVEKELGNPDRAVALYLEAEEAFPFNARLPNDRGLLLMGLGREEEALGAFREALDRDPEFLDALENMGAYSRLRGEYDAAKRSFLRALTRVREEGGDTGKFRRYLDMIARESEGR